MCFRIEIYRICFGKVTTYNAAMNASEAIAINNPLKPYKSTIILIDVT